MMEYFVIASKDSVDHHIESICYGYRYAKMLVLKRNNSFPIFFFGKKCR